MNKLLVLRSRRCAKRYLFDFSVGEKLFMLIGKNVIFYTNCYLLVKMGDV